MFQWLTTPTCLYQGQSINIKVQRTDAQHAKSGDRHHEPTNKVSSESLRVWPAAYSSSWQNTPTYKPIYKVVLQEQSTFLIWISGFLPATQFSVARAVKHPQCMMASVCCLILEMFGVVHGSNFTPAQQGQGQDAVTFSSVPERLHSGNFTCRTGHVVWHIVCFVCEATLFIPVLWFKRQQQCRQQNCMFMKLTYKMLLIHFKSTFFNLTFYLL